MNETPATPTAQALLEKAFPPSEAAIIFTDKLYRKHLYTLAADNRELRREARHRKKQQRTTNRKPKPLTAREKRVLRIHEIPREAEKYAIYEPLHRLWVGYMQEILNINPKAGCAGGVGAGPAQIGLKLASADYHGALFEVIRSRCPSRVGIKGICVKETKSMFYIITRGDKMKGQLVCHCFLKFFYVRSKWRAEWCRDSKRTFGIPV